MGVGRYKKLLVAAVGFVALLLKDLFDVEVGVDKVDAVVDAIIIVVDLAIMYFISNTTTSQKEVTVTETTSTNNEH